MNQAPSPITTPPAASQRLHAPFQASANVRTRIKICGLTREEDVDAAVAAGADAVGFVLYAPSPRAVTPQRACASTPVGTVTASQYFRSKIL